MRYISVLLTTLLLLTMLTACSAADGGPVVDDSAPTPIQKGTEEELQTLLDRVATIPVATMGVTMKITEVAAVALDWCEKTAMDDAQLHDALTAYYTACDDQMVYLEQMYSVAGRMGMFEDESYRERYLADAGLEASDYEWSDAAFGKAKVFAEAVEEWMDLPADIGTEPCFKATVTEVRDQSVLVTPLEGEDELRSADLITVHLPADAPSIAVGDTVLIEYDGMIAESYPSQVDADTITVVTE